MKNLILFACTFVSLTSFAQTTDRKSPNFLFECADPSYQMSFMTGEKADLLFDHKNTVTVDNHSMPYVQKIEIESIQHDRYFSDYVVVANISHAKTCVGFSGERDDCDSTYFIKTGTLTLTIKPKVIFTREREAEEGKTVATFTYSDSQGDLRTAGLSLCYVNFANLQTLIKK